MEEIANWLKGKGIKFAAGSASRSAEQIPLELLPKIHPLKTGQGLVLEGPQTITVMRLAGAQSAPVSEEVALPRIQQFLSNQRAAEAAKQELKTLKANAKITYMGEFAVPMVRKLRLVLHDPARPIQAWLPPRLSTGAAVREDGRIKVKH